jgi:hypothetical protein
MPRDTADPTGAPTSATGMTRGPGSGWTREMAAAGTAGETAAGATACPGRCQRAQTISTASWAAG